MANPENIKPYEFTSDQNREEAAKNGRKGGIASGKARRKKASMERAFKRVFESDIPAAAKMQIETLTGQLDDEDDTLLTATFAITAKEALSGDQRAVRNILEFAKFLNDKVTVDETIEDDAFSQALEQRARGLDNADQ